MKDYREFDETSPESQDDTKELVSGIEEFINTFKNSSNVKELIDSYSSDFMFMPLSTVMARDMFKLYGDEFTKVHLLWMLALNCNYQINNVCVAVSKENLSKLILNRYLDNTPDSEDNYEDIADQRQPEGERQHGAGAVGDGKGFPGRGRGGRADPRGQQGHTGLCGLQWLCEAGQVRV